MKREIHGKGSVKAPEPMKSVERQFGEAIQYMVDLMAKRYRNQVFKELNKSTIEKFEDSVASPELLADLEGRGYKFADAQVGNFANVFLRLADRAKRKLLQQFDDKRLEQLAKQYTGKVDQRNRQEFYKRIEEKVGISRKELESTEGLTFQINAYKLETYQWIRKMRDDTLQQWTSNTLRDMAEGKNLEEILSQFDNMVEKRKNHAQMVARTQIATFNSLTTKARAQNLGITKARWVTSRDERVRGKPGGRYPNAKPDHHWADGKEFDLSKGLKFPSGAVLLPGTDYNCRCDYELVLPEPEE